MSPEDEKSQAEQISAKSAYNANSNLKSQQIKDSYQLPSRNGISLKNGYVNDDAILKNNNDSQTWLPLLVHHPTDVDHSMPITNNNKWPALTSPNNLLHSKNIWKELPHDDESMGIYHTNYNGMSGLSNGIGINDIRNGYADKGEHESLTGIVRQTSNGYATKKNRLDEYDEDINCGIGMCKPRWARTFASTHVFMVIFLLAWILQGMYYTYFVSVITTIEKLFQIKSKTTGLLMSATEIGQISTALFLTYYAGRGHRPRWIAFGMIVFAFAALGCTLPHFLFGNEILHANNAFYGGDSDSAIVITTSMALRNTSSGVGHIDDVQPNTSANLCRTPELNASKLNDACGGSMLLEQEAHSQIRNIVLGIFFLSLLFVGIGQTAVSTLGIPYIDDNVASKESAIYMAITIGVRILGPAAGFILGSFCTRLYVDLSDPGFGPSDPKWVGAWYLGLVMISSIMIVTAIAMFMFPKQLRGNKIASGHSDKPVEKILEEESKPQLKDFPKTIKRQLKNDILMFRTASSVLHLLPIAGLYTFLPKYLESQFNLPAHDANLISGLGGILVMGIGIVISGVVLLKFSPTARSVAAWIAFTALIYSLGMAVLMFVGCPLEQIVGLADSRIAPSANLTAYDPSCTTACDCDKNKFSPICGPDKQTYFSSCIAGCSSSHIKNGQTEFSNCKCIPGQEEWTAEANAISGICDGKCQSFVMFISLFSFLVFIHSTSEVGSMLLIMRCTDPKDKAMAMGIIQFAIGLFGNVPCPIIYGAVIDSTCLIWETICGKQGACSLYDPDAFRHFFLGTTSGIMFLAFIMDVIVWRKAHRIDIDPESKQPNAPGYENGKHAGNPESSM